MLVVLALGSALAALGSVIFAGRQSQQLAAQTSLANKVAIATTLREAVRHYDEALTVFLEYPELKPYFYDGMDSPADPAIEVRVGILAEILADSLDSSLVVASEIGDSEALDGWTSTAESFLRKSPALRRVLDEQVCWADLSLVAGNLTMKEL